MFGARVKLVDEDTDEEASYQVVGPDEADIQSGLLSIQSPWLRPSWARRPARASR